MLTKKVDLTDKAKKQVKQQFVYWLHDTTSETFDEWANKHAFYTRKGGGLNARYNHCEPLPTPHNKP